MQITNSLHKPTWWVWW